MKINYFNITYAVKEHNNIIDKVGGLAGVRDLGVLKSPLDHIQNDDYYPLFEDKITHLVFSIGMSHPFLDGNKRTSIVLGAFFLQINGYPTTVISNFIETMEHLIIMCIDHVITKEQLNEYITLIISDRPFSENLQLLYINGMERILSDNQNFID